MAFVICFLLVTITVSVHCVSQLESTLPPVYSFFDKYGPFLTVDSVLGTNFTRVNAQCASSLEDTEKAIYQQELWALKCKFVFQFYIPLHWDKFFLTFQ